MDDSERIADAVRRLARQDWHAIGNIERWFPPEDPAVAACSRLHTVLEVPMVHELRYYCSGCMAKWILHRKLRGDPHA